MIDRSANTRRALRQSVSRGLLSVASALAHLAVFYLVVISLQPSPPPAPSPVIDVWLVRTPSVPSARSDRIARRTDASLGSVKHPPRQSLRALEPSGGAPSTSPSPERGSISINGTSDGVQDRLRTSLGALLACQPERLKDLPPIQREACQKTVVETAKTAQQLDPIPADKRGYFDKVAAAYEARHAPTPVALAAPPCPTCERWAPPPGAHAPSIGCSIPFGAPPGWKPVRRKRPHSVTLGPCSIGPPQGFLTEEADIPSAADAPRP
jgi:hypothetical protein